MDQDIGTRRSNAKIFIAWLLLAVLLVACRSDATTNRPPWSSSIDIVKSTAESTRISTFILTSTNTPKPIAKITPAPIGGGCITFIAYRDGNPEIYVMNADGSGKTNITNNPEHDWAPDWSPRGGCGQTSSTTDPLDGTSWVLSSLDGKPPIADTRITLIFSDGYVSGSAGCNDYFRLDIAGKYEVTGEGSLMIPSIGIQQILCLKPEGVMDQEDAFSKVLSSAATFRLMEKRLEIADVSGEVILVYTR